MKLGPVQRVKLLELLPERGDILTLKILRKLRESLSFSEQEMQMVMVRREYACTFEERDEMGKVTRCLVKEFFSAPLKCAIHDLQMSETGRINMVFDSGFGSTEKEIVMGAQALSMAAEAVKRLEGQKELAEEHLTLYEKFFPPEKEAEC